MFKIHVYQYNFYIIVMKFARELEIFPGFLPSMQYSKNLYMVSALFDTKC